MNHPEFSHQHQKERKMITKNTKAAQRTQRCNFDKALYLEESLVNV